jgi:uncharacterized lipoprotein NlpE involved in copper resistance
MKKQAILALILVLALVSCKNNTNNQTDHKEQPVTTAPTAQTTTNEEPILKPDHVFSGDCAATSLDWPGNYLGAVANKNGIARLRLTLNKDWAFTLKIMALEDLKTGDVKENLQKEVTGTFTFDKTGQIIKLLGTNHPATNDMISVGVGENYLSVLGGDLKPLGKDGDMNTLYK